MIIISPVPFKNEISVIDMTKLLVQWRLKFDAKHILIPYIHLYQV